MTSLTDYLSLDQIETIRRDSLHKVEATCDETRAMCDELLASRTHRQILQSALQSMYLRDYPDDPHGMAYDYDDIIKELAVKLGIELEETPYKWW